LSNPDVTNNAVLAKKAWDDLNAWRASQGGSQPQGYAQGMDAMGRLYRYANVPSLVPLLPQLLSLNGKPFTLNDHFPFEPIYKRFHIPQQTVLKCGRQVSKSTSLAVQGIIQSAVRPYFKTLFVCPLFEQIRRFSTNYVRPFINNSPVKSALIGEAVSGAQNVLQRTMKNESIMFFTFCFLDAERVRGISADKLAIDEVQDINWDFIEVLRHCLSASDYKFRQYSGTSKTEDNTLERLWRQSSMAEWCIKCVCGKWNVMNREQGLVDMIRKEGLMCPNCSRFINPRLGNWEHQVTDREIIRDFAGYHVPQPLLPMHLPTECGGDPKKGPDAWQTIWRAKNKGDQVKFFNECLGEACDVSSKLVNLSELRRAAKLPWKNDVNEALARAGDYPMLTMGVDWGGGAGGIVRRVRGVLVVEGGTPSFTAATVCGFRPGTVLPDVLFAHRFASSTHPYQEVKQILQWYQQFGCYRLGHDFGGAGNMREVIMLQTGFPMSRVFPAMYVPAISKNMVTFVPPSGQNTRSYYTVDKARSLSMLCSLIKCESVRLPEWESFKDIGEEFLCLVEDKRERPSGADIVLITRDPSKSDDFCHALNFACISHWHSVQQFPDLAEQFNVGLSMEQMDALYPDLSEQGITW
jgi:hypothetical protein